MEGVQAVLETLSQTLSPVADHQGATWSSKMPRSRGPGLAPHFDGIHILAEKDVGTYRKVLQSAGVEARSFLMVGNSVRSDIAPVLALGARAVHIPYRITWAHETTDGAQGEFKVRHVDGHHRPAGLSRWAGLRETSQCRKAEGEPGPSARVDCRYQQGRRDMTALPKKGDKVSWKTPQGETHGHGRERS